MQRSRKGKRHGILCQSERANLERSILRVLSSRSTEEKHIVKESRIDLNNIRVLPCNQDRPTTAEGVTRILDYIKRNNFRPHLIHALVQEHAKGCKCDICDRSCGAGVDLFRGFHRIEAIKVLEAVNPLKLLSLRNEGKILITATVMPSDVSREVMKAQRENHDFRNLENWYVGVQKIVKNFTLWELQSHTFVETYWNPIMPYIDPTDKFFKLHLDKAKWILENDMAMVWITLFKYMKKDFSIESFERLMAMRNFAMPIMQATLYFMIMLESSAKFIDILIGVKILHEHEHCQLTDVLNLRNFESFKAVIPKVKAKPATEKKKTITKTPLETTRITRAALKTVQPTKPSALELRVLKTIKETKNLREATVEKKTKVRAETSNETTVTITKAPRRKLPSKSQRKRFSDELNHLKEGWNAYSKGVAKLEDLKKTLANLNASFDQMEDSQDKDRPEITCLNALLSLNR